MLRHSRGPFWNPSRASVSRPPLPIRNKTNEELAQKFSEWVVAQRYARVTQLAYKRVAFRFCHFLGSRSLVTANRLDVRSFLVEVMKRDLSVDGYNRHLWALRRFFDFLYMGGVVDSIAPRFVLGKRHPRPMPRVLGETELKLLIRSASGIRDAAILELPYATGCRVGELVRIRVEDIDTKRRSIRMTGKSGERTVFYGSQASKVLRKYLNGRKSGPLFRPVYRKQHGCVNWNGKGWEARWVDYSTGTENARAHVTGLGGRMLTRQKAWQQFRKRVPQAKLVRPPENRHVCTTAIARVIELAAHKARLGRVTAHMIRHSFATHLLNRGADIRHIQGLLGHTSIQTTQLYTRVVPAELERTLRRFHPRG